MNFSHIDFSRLSASVFAHELVFKKASKTSRDTLHTKKIWLLRLSSSQFPEKLGWGECTIIPGLSIEPEAGFETKVREVAKNISSYADFQHLLIDFPAIIFGLETALLDLSAARDFELWPTAFSQGKTPIPINGLVWMGTAAEMSEQVKEKIAAGFDCIKLKIGAIDWEEELAILKGIRAEFSVADIELRVDANGAFTNRAPLEKLKTLADLQIHSIEQPVAANHWELMSELCEKTPLPIALDEELIGRKTQAERIAVLDNIVPQYIILKPSLVGGFAASQAWVDLAKAKGIDFWITSALEGNVGLNAIAQWTATLDSSLPQGLGTGQLYRNNIPSPLHVADGLLHYTNSDWDLTMFEG